MIMPIKSSSCQLNVAKNWMLSGQYLPQKNEKQSYENIFLWNHKIRVESERPLCSALCVNKHIYLVLGKPAERLILRKPDMRIKHKLILSEFSL